ncbi:MAG: type II restriction endonuclease subunit R, partial [Gammaproteobacteria bacterium]|nr:type II restriction endonuclease subunit R [Gammaproteobacteria bacterium]
DFATTINTILTEQDIPEDRHLGPFFLSEEEMKNNPKEALTGKLFMYLWDDVLRHGMKDTVFDSEVKKYGQLTRKYNNSEKIFSDSFYHLLVSEYFEPESLLREVAEENPDYKTDE